MMINFLMLLVASVLSEDTYVFDKDEKVLFSYDMQGVKVDVLRRGDCHKKAEDGDMLTAEFHGFLADTLARFESSHDAGKPSSFKIGHGYMIKGLERGLQQICIAEKRRLHIPAELAYAKVGDGKNVPPGADLVYDVEVINIQKGKLPPNIFARIDINKDELISKDEMANFILETGNRI
eukprot:sb/3471744/